MANTSQRMATVYRAGSVEDAAMVRIKLAGAGIDAFIQGENAAVALGYIGPGLNTWGIQVLVPAADAEHAEAVLNEAVAREVGEPPSENRGAYKDDEGADRPAPTAGAEPVVLNYAQGISADDYARRALVALAFFLIFPPVALVSLYCAIKAKQEAHRSGVEQPNTFRRRLITAWIGLALFAALCVASIWHGILWLAQWLWTRLSH